MRLAGSARPSGRARIETGEDVSGNRVSGVAPVLRGGRGLRTEWGHSQFPEASASASYGLQSGSRFFLSGPPLIGGSPCGWSGFRLFLFAASALIRPEFLQGPLLRNMILSPGAMVLARQDLTPTALV